LGGGKERGPHISAARKLGEGGKGAEGRGNFVAMSFEIEERTWVRTGKNCRSLISAEEGISRGGGDWLTEKEVNSSSSVSLLFGEEAIAFFLRGKRGWGVDPSACRRSEL